MINFTHITIDWYVSTMILYVSIIIMCYIATWIKKKTLKINNKKFDVAITICSILWLFFKCFGTSGRDLRGGFYLDFVSASSLGSFRDQSLEIGYKLLNVIVNNIFDSYYIFLIIVGLITIVPVLKLLREYKDKVDLSAVVLFYTCVYYFSGFSIFRMAMAASISLYAFDAMVKKKPWRALLFILLSITIHTSMILMFIPYVFVFMKIFDRKLIAFSSVALFGIVLLSRDSIASQFLSSGRYYVYGISNDVNIGLEQFFYFLPLLALLLWMRKKGDVFFFRVSIAYVSTAFCFGMLSYIVPIFGRTNTVFLPLIFIAGYYIKLAKQHHKKYNFLIDFIVILYCAVRFWLYISQYYNLDDIMPYTNMFGWII